MLTCIVKSRGWSALLRPATQCSLRQLRSSSVTVPRIPLEDVESSFLSADVDNSGYLEPDELRTMLRKQGCNMSQAQFADLMASMDANNDGRISLEEFQNFLYPVDLEGSGCIHEAQDGERTPENRMRELAAL